MTKLLNKKISVCLSSDDNYALWMGCSIYSILKNTGTNDVLNFYIFEDGISAEHKRELESLVKNTVHKIHFISVPFEKLPALHINHAHLSRAAFARLLMGSLLPQGVEKVIYLDCDVMVCTSLSGLHEVDLKEHILGGVSDLGVERLRRLGSHPWNTENGPYINSGVLIINLARWRKDNIEQEILRCLQNSQYPLDFEDQDVINFVLAKRIKILDPRWNAQMYWLEKDYNNYPPCYRQALESPFIVHFAARTKPWQWGSGWHKHTLQWRKYFKETGWKLESAPPLWPLFKRVMWYWWRHPVCFLNPSFYNQLKSRGRWLFY